MQAWWQQHGQLSKQRSTDGWSKWWTHDRLRKAWLLLSHLSGNGHLFTFVTHGNAGTTSPLEGGINNGIRTTLRNHRGMSEAHMKRATEWFLCTRELIHKFCPTSSKQNSPNLQLQVRAISMSCDISPSG
ncbi:hypothetical protein C5E05_14005 [Pseudoclavibacter sp. AY1H1]|nr:hypothetical protein C5E05_14005 [Pseudoclavibacter sp. AY1H1]